MRKIFSLFMIITILIIPIIKVNAHAPLEFWLENAWTHFDNLEKELAAAVVELNRLDSLQRDLKVEWDDNNEDMRDSALSALGSIGPMSVASFIANAAMAGLDLIESMTLSESLDAAIWAARGKYDECILLEKMRDGAFNTLTYFIDIHNMAHKTPSINLKYPIKTPWKITVTIWEFHCGGGCGMSMPSPVSTHLTPCDACGADYYVCNADDVAKHGERPCTRKIKVVKEMIDPYFGSTYYVTTYIKCNIKHRWCTPTKSPHKIDVKVNGSKKMGPDTRHYPKPRIPPPHVGTM